MKLLRNIPLALCLLLAPAPGAEQVDPQRYLEHVKYLASDQLGGRGSGTPGLDAAAGYIAQQFRSLGLTAIGADGYFQTFQVTTDARLGPENRFTYSQDGRASGLKFDEDFRPFNFSSAGQLSGQVVFAGYGITAPEYNYDDYAGIDAKDKFVLVLRHEPQEFDEKSVFGGKAYTSHAQFESKAVNAKFHGARGVILVNDQPNHPGDADDLEKFSAAVGPASPGVPFVQIKTAVADKWISGAGKSLDQIVKAIDQGLKPQSFTLPASLRVDLAVDVKRQVRPVRNVIGYLPGETGEYLILGAHYDHLGLGEQYSMAPSEAGKAIHHGADDNASGTAGVIELARVFSKEPKRHRGVLFITFASEELGLLGSNYYVNHPLLPLDKAVAMINMDMIGRLRENKVYLGGTGTGSSFKDLILGMNGGSKLNIDFSDAGGYGSSDHYSFTPKQVPVLFFFSGLHGDYHKPSDTWDRIDAPATARLLDFVAELSEKLVAGPERPKYVRIEEPAGAHAAAAGGGPGYGAYFGSVPDFGMTEGGVKFADVRENSPAARAGLKAGDILIEFDGKPINNLYDFTYALRSKKPGDEVAVKVRRGTGVIEARTVLEKRK